MDKKIKSIKSFLSKIIYKLFISKSNKFRSITFLFISIIVFLFFYSTTLLNFLNVGNTGYVQLSKCLLNKLQLGCKQPSAFRVPGYPLFLGILGWISSYNTIFMGIAHFMLLILMSLLTWKLFNYVFDNKVFGWLAGLLVLVHPYLYFLVTRVADTALFSLVFLFGVYLLIRVIEKIKEGKISALRLFCLAAIVATSILFRPSGIWLFVSSFLVILFFSIRKSTYKKSVKRIGIFSVSFALILSPWVARNYIQFGSFIPLSTNGGINLLKGHNKNYQLVHPTWDIDIIGSNLKKEIRIDNQVEVNSYYTQKAIKNFLNSPGYYLILDIKKFFDWFRPQKVPRIYNTNNRVRFNPRGKQHVEVFVNYSTGKELIYIFYWSFILFFASLGTFSGLLKSNNRYRPYILLLSFVILTYSIEGILAFPDTRFRIPTDPLIIILATFGLKESISWLRKNNNYFYSFSQKIKNYKS